MKNLNFKILTLVCLLSFQNTFAQIQTRFIKASQVSRNSTLKKNIIHKTISERNLKALLVEDSIEAIKHPKRPYRVGKGNKVSIDVLKEGYIFKIGDSTFLNYSIHSVNL